MPVVLPLFLNILERNFLFVVLAPHCNKELSTLENLSFYL
jgi:hypothetical protein